MRELSNVGVSMKKPSFLCPAAMKHMISSDTIIQLLIVWLMGEFLSHKGSIVRMEIALFSKLSPNLWHWKPPFRPCNTQIHGNQSQPPSHFIPCLLASSFSPFSPATPYLSLVSLGLFGPPLILLPPSFLPSFSMPYPSLSTFAALFYAVFSPLLFCPPSPFSSAAWSLRWHPHHSNALVLKALLFGELNTSPSHAQDFNSAPLMASVGSIMFLHPLSFSGPGSSDALRFLLHIISGIGEGSIQGLPW